MKWLGSFILACLALATALLAVFDGSVAAFFNFGTKSLDTAAQFNRASITPSSFVPTPVPQYQPVSQASPAVQFRITSFLSEGQLSEVTKVYMGDARELVGEFNLTPLSRAGSFSVRGDSGPGSYRYSLSSTLSIRTDDGTRYLHCGGDGSVWVQSNSTLSVALISYSPLTGDCEVGLQWAAVGKRERASCVVAWQMLGIAAQPDPNGLGNSADLWQ
jgi:hypothetical protein